MSDRAWLLHSLAHWNMEEDMPGYVQCGVCNEWKDRTEFVRFSDPYPLCFDCEEHTP